MLQEAQSSLDTAKEKPIKKQQPHSLKSRRVKKQAVPLVLQSKRNGTLSIQEGHVSLTGASFCRL
jgi:hypothetical protein